MVKIREMNEKDIVHCCTVYMDAFRTTDAVKGFYDLPRYFSGFIGRDDRYAYCILHNDETVGFITAIKMPSVLYEYDIFIDTVAVAPQHQKKGYGSSAVRQFDGLFSEEISIKLITEKSLPAYKMYDDIGFADLECTCMSLSPISNYIKQLRAEKEKYMEEIAQLKDKLDSLTNSPG